MVTIGERIVNLINQNGGMIDDLTVYRSGVKYRPVQMRNRLRYYLGNAPEIRIYERREGTDWFWCTEEYAQSDTTHSWTRL